jgi:hypothetical protein
MATKTKFHISGTSIAFTNIAVDPSNSSKGWWAVSQRDANLLWLKDLLGHLEDCQGQLEWADDEETIHLLTESMIRDLESCRRICEGLRRRVRTQYVA